MRSLVVVAGVLSLAALTGPAQNCLGNHLGFFVGSVNTAAGSHIAYKVDANGNVTTFQTGTGWPIWGNTFGACMDWDNKTVILPGILGSGPPYTIGLFQFDPAANAIVGTIWSGALSPSNINNWANWDLTSDGDPVTVDNSTSPQAIAVYDRFQGKWLRYNLPASFQAAGGISGVEWDKLAGGILHAAWGSPSALWKSNLVASPPVHTSLAVHTARVSRYGGTQVDNGDWISSTCCSFQYYIVKKGSGSWSAGPAAGSGSTISYDTTHENYACPGRGVFTANFSPGGVRHIDLVTGTVTTIGPTLGSVLLEAVPLYSRDLWAKRTGKAKWIISFNPGNGRCAGKAYIIGVSITPPTPVALGSGREIFVGVDPILLLSLSGSLAPYFTGNVGTLSATGQATALLDLSGLGQIPPLTLFFVAVALDSQAPDGVCWVSDPFAHQAKVLP